MHVIGAMIAYHYLYLNNSWDDISALDKLISHDDYASLISKLDPRQAKHKLAPLLCQPSLKK